MIYNAKSEVTGSVWKIVTKVGQSLEPGDTLMIIESMKMEIPVLSPIDGLVVALNVVEGEVVGAFMRFDEEHHNFVIGKAPVGVDVEAAEMKDRLVQQISFEVDSRDEFLKSVAHLRSKGAKIVAGPLVHGFEGDGKNFNGSGSRSVYFADPDGNRLEIFTDMMRVPHGEQFPRAEYADLFETLRAEAGVPAD